MGAVALGVFLLLFAGAPVVIAQQETADAPAQQAVTDDSREKERLRRLFGGAATSARPQWRTEQYDPRPAKGDARRAELRLPMPCGGNMVFRRIDVGGPGLLAEDEVQLGSAAAANAPEEGRRLSHLAGAFDADGTSTSPGAMRHFYLGKYEVSALQYRVLRGACPQILSGRRPAVRVSWYDAVDFTRRYTEWLYRVARERLPEQDGVRGFLRLPTESEWEYAARGGLAVSAGEFRQTVFPMAGRSLGDYAWIRESVSSSFEPHPIGALLANPLGLHDMLGNAAELVFDLYRLSVNGRMHGQAGGFLVKGGHFRSWRKSLGTSWRREHPHFNPRTGSANRLDTVGFRVAISTPVLTSERRIERIREQASVLPPLPDPPLAAPARVEPPQWADVRARLELMDAQETRLHGQLFLRAAQPDRALVLFKRAVRKGDGWSALAIGAMYDPLLFEAEDFDAARTPFSRPNPDLARCWYRVAQSLDEAQAVPRMRMLDARHRQVAPDSAHTSANCDAIMRRYGGR